MSPWTIEQVNALAPDASSASAGQSLASVRKWSSLGRSERAVWGLCQGSGKDPYQARVDLSEPAFKCSCPSRKFPCKHGLGLLLLFAKDAAQFKSSPEPAWVADWLAGRAERSEKKLEQAKVAEEKPVDPEAQAKRAAKRSERMQEGIAACRTWLEDLVRQGLAAAKSEGASTWDRAAARMVDAQAGGLAGWIASIPESLASGDGWDLRTLDLLGRLHLLLSAAERIDRLPPDLSVTVQSLLGKATNKDEVLAQEGVTDTWIVAGQSISEDGTVRSRRTWLFGRSTARRALILDFAPGSRSFDASLPFGVEFDGELAFYPASLPLRALVKDKGESRPFSGADGTFSDRTIEQALQRYAQSLAVDPWLNRWPLLLGGAAVGRDGDRWWLLDSTGRGLPFRPSFTASVHLWRLIAASAGREVLITAEWDGEYATPIGLLDHATHQFCDLSPRWAA